MRNVVGDFANDYQVRRKRDIFFSFLSYLIILLFFAGEVAFYYGMRLTLVDLYHANPSSLETTVFFIHPLALICYSIYFIGNGIINMFIYRPLIRLLTNLENLPTFKDYSKSRNRKLVLFAIGVELIGPIDLTYIQPSAKTECLSYDCFN